MRSEESGDNTSNNAIKGKTLINSAPAFTASMGVGGEVSGNSSTDLHQLTGVRG